MSEPLRIDVCIATFRRPVRLRRLLQSLAAQTLDGSFIYRIIVVDNDRAGSARSVVLQWASARDVHVSYCIEPVANVALARNRCLAQARGDYLAFIDDDEVASSDWLATLLATARHTCADAVFGPVLPILPPQVPAWTKAGRFFFRRRYSTGTPRPFGGTGNVLLRIAALRRAGLRFDPAFGRTGGEDTDLFWRWSQAGARMVWCDEAVVHEYVSVDRLCVRWLLRRAYRNGRVFARVLFPVWSLPTRVRWLLKKTLLLVSVMTAFPLLLVLRRTWGIRALERVSSMLGQLSGAVRSGQP